MKPQLLLLIAALATSGLAATATDRPQGWASQNGGTTGGAAGAETTVSTMSELQAAAKKAGPAIIWVKPGTYSGRVVLTSDKTILGQAPGVVIEGGIDIKGVKNVIVRNLKVVGPGAVDVNGIDCIGVDNSTNIWLDHLDVSDGQDGNMDIVNGANYVTVSWTKFTYTSKSSNHMFSNLFGNSDSKTTDRTKLKITVINNWWADGVQERMPRVRFGQVHVVNNLFTSKQATHCVRAGLEADLLVEANAFIGVKKPIDLYEGNYTAVTVKNNLFQGTTADTVGNKTAFTPPYTLTLIETAKLQATISSATTGAGATLSFGPPSVGLGTRAMRHDLAVRNVSAGIEVRNSGDDAVSIRAFGFDGRAIGRRESLPAGAAAVLPVQGRAALVEISGPQGTRTIQVAAPH